MLLIITAQRQMAEANIDEGMIRRQRAILSSMTADERQRPKLIQASRKRRIASGSGTSVQDVNKLLKQFQMMSKMMKKVGKMGNKGLMRHGLRGSVRVVTCRASSLLRTRLAAINGRVVPTTWHPNCAYCARLGVPKFHWFSSAPNLSLHFLGTDWGQVLNSPSFPNVRNTHSSAATVLSSSVGRLPIEPTSRDADGHVDRFAP